MKKRKKNRGNKKEETGMRKRKERRIEAMKMTLVPPSGFFNPF